MFLYSGKLGKRTPCGPNEVHPTSTGPGSPEILCNPFCLPSPELAHQDGPRLSATRHLVCDDLPDIYLIPPNGDPLKTAICVWDSRFDGIFSSFLDSDPSTPVATPVGSSCCCTHHTLTSLLRSVSNAIGSHSQALIRR